MARVRARLCKLQKGCTQLAPANDKVYQLLAHGRWFSLGTPASSTTKTDRHDIAEILLKVALNTKKSINKSNRLYICQKSPNMKILQKNSEYVYSISLPYPYCLNFLVHTDKKWSNGYFRKFQFLETSAIFEGGLICWTYVLKRTNTCIQVEIGQIDSKMLK